MDDSKLNVKDYVTIGVISAIGAALFLAIGALMAATPVSMIFVHGIIAVPLGILYMLLYARAPKPGTVFLGSVVPMLWMLMGNVYSPLIMLAITAANEWFWRRGDRKKFARMAAAFTVMMSGWAVASFAPFVLLRGRYLKNYEEAAPFYEQMYNTLAGPLGLAAFLCAVAGGLAGACLGRALLQKHFEKAGIV